MLPKRAASAAYWAKFIAPMTPTRFSRAPRFSSAAMTAPMDDSPPQATSAAAATLRRRASCARARHRFRLGGEALLHELAHGHHVDLAAAEHGKLVEHPDLRRNHQIRCVFCFGEGVKIGPGGALLLGE